MSFGYSVGDCIAVLGLAREIYKRYSVAPEEFRQVSVEVGRLTNILQDVKSTLAESEDELSDWQKIALPPILSGCNNAMDKLKKIADESQVLEEPTRQGLRHKTARFWKRLTWDPAEVQSLYGHLIYQVTSLNAFLTSLNSKTLRSTKSAVDQLLKRDEIREDRTEHRAILEWLSQTDYNDQQTDYLKLREPGTGEWILETTEYKAWMNGLQQTLFCPGLPGAGKTILASIIVDSLYTTFQDDDTSGVSYLFCNFRSQHNPEDLLAALAKQLLHARLIPPDVKKIFLSHKQRCTRPSIKEVSETLLSTARLYSKVHIVVDALDECHDNCRRRFLSELFNIQAKSSINVLVTSRYIPDIVKEFNNNKRLEIRAREGDVQKYLSSQMLRLPDFVRRNVKLQEEIQTSIENAFDGMFLLARLYIDSLEGKPSVKTLRTALQKLPTGSNAYDEIYKTAMERIEGQIQDARDLARQVISWITWAKRPLTVQELRCALGIELDSSELDEENLPDVEYMLSVCAGLVAIDEESQIIRLVHYTIQEYLERTRKHWALNVETEMTSMCVTLLSYNVFEDGECKTRAEFMARTAEYPLLNYAACHWGDHARQLPTLSQLVFDFLRDDAKVAAASQVRLAIRNEFRSNLLSTGLHLAAQFGLVEGARFLLDDGLVPDFRDYAGRTPLSWAAESGHETIITILLDWSTVDADSRDLINRTPLSYAAQAGHVAVVEMLLGTGQVDANSSDAFGRTSLSWAAQHGHITVMACLLRNGKESLNYPSFWGLTPLAWAALEGMVESVEFLLEAGADVNTADNVGSTPLARAVEGGYDAVVKVLLKQQAVDVNAKSTLHHAIVQRHPVIVELLLGDVRTDPNQLSAGLTSLWVAIFSRWERAIELLLTHVDVDPNAMCPSSNGDTPLTYAVEEDLVSIARLLLDTGRVNVNAKIRFDQTALSRAAHGGCTAMVELLLSVEGIETDCQDDTGWTPLILAAMAGEEDVVSLLLEKSTASPTHRDIEGRTALSWAASAGHLSVVQLLLPRYHSPARQDASDAAGRTPLWWAAAKGHDLIVDALLASGIINTERADARGFTPLMAAAMDGHVAVVRVLLQNNADVDAGILTGWTALQRAMLRTTPNLEMERMLVAHGASEPEDFYSLETLFSMDCGCSH